MSELRTDDFAYDLPPELIAQNPVEPRDRARLLVVERASGRLQDARVSDLPAFLRPGDLLVVNQSRVLPARLFGRKAGGGARVELLLLRQEAPGEWQALVRPGRRLPPGTRVELDGPESAAAEVGEALGEGVRRVRLPADLPLAVYGVVPLPPYIHAPLADPERYQTVYARPEGSVAAPTAGLHFTPELLGRLGAMGVERLAVTLHVGPGTFRPVEASDPRAHPLHGEWAELSPEVATRINQAKTEGRRIVAVGTTVVRTLEHAAQVAAPGETVAPFKGETRLFILPGYCFQVVDALLTNFHLPRSTLLMLVATLAGKPLIDRAYRHAIAQRYRFYSFGDAMLIV